MLKLLASLSAVAAVAVLSHAALAQDHDGPKRPALRPKVILEHLKAADTNGDGKLSKDEAPERLKAHFDRIDADHDGFLTKEEVEKALRALAARIKQSAFRPRVILERLKAADANGDGKLSKDEAPERLKAHFDKIDADHDGFLTKEEIERALRALAARLGQPGANVRAITQRLKAADANGDGKLSKDEAPERLKAHFDQIDTDGDGQLTPDELKPVVQRIARGLHRPAE